MTSRPSKFAEALVMILVPPACREEIVGDLHERFRSPAQYVFDAFRTVPLVILSRVRRRSESRVILIEALSLYAAFVGAALMKDSPLLRDGGGFALLALPAFLALIGIRLEDAYAKPGPRSPLALTGGTAVALAVAVIFSYGVLPAGLLPAGSAFALVVCSGLRILFAPAAKLRL